MPFSRGFTNLIGGLEYFLFFHILGISSSQLTNIWLKPPTSNAMFDYQRVVLHQWTPSCIATTTRTSKLLAPYCIYIYTLSVQTLRICRVWSETLGLPMMIVNTSCLHVKHRVSQHVLRILPSPGCQLGGAWLSSVSRHVGGTYLWYNIL